MIQIIDIVMKINDYYPKKHLDYYSVVTLIQYKSSIIFIN